MDLIYTKTSCSFLELTSIGNEPDEERIFDLMLQTWKTEGDLIPNLIHYNRLDRPRVVKCLESMGWERVYEGKSSHGGRVAAWIFNAEHLRKVWEDMADDLGITFRAKHFRW